MTTNEVRQGLWPRVLPRVGFCEMGDSDQSVVARTCGSTAWKGSEPWTLPSCRPIVSSNTQPSTVVIAEKAVDLIAANTRTAFRQPLSNIQVIQTKIGLMATDYEAARLLTLAASDSFALGRGGDPILLSKAKLFSTDAAMRHAVEAVQIFGAMGVHHSSRVQRLFRDSKALQIFDGTSEIHTLMIGRDALNAHRQEEEQVERDRQAG